MLLLPTGGCLGIFRQGTEPRLEADVGVGGNGQGRATACDLLQEHDVRASRLDTLDTQRTLYSLQQTKAKCEAEAPA